MANLSEQVLARIGAATVAFSEIEQNLQLLVWDLIGAGQRIGRAVTAEVSFKVLRGMADCVYRERYGVDDHYPTLRTLLKRAGDLEAERNQVQHSWWASNGPTEVTRVKSSAKEAKGLQLKIHELEASDLAAISDRMGALAHEIFTFMLVLSAAAQAAAAESVEP